MRLSAKEIALRDLLENKTVIIFGAGIAGKGVLKILNREKISVAAFHDNGALQPYSMEGHYRFTNGFLDAKSERSRFYQRRRKTTSFSYGDISRLLLFKI